MADNKITKKEIRIVENFIKYLASNLDFTKKNIEKLNDVLNDKLKAKFEEYMEAYIYFENYRFSPLRTNTNVLGYRKSYQETAYTNLLGHFLKNSVFKNNLLKSLLCLIDIDKNYDIEDIEIEDVNCEAKIKSGKIDVLCMCNMAIDGKKEILIEAKVDAKESKGQTEKYYKYKKNDVFAFIFLTKEETTPACKEFKNITWLDLAAAFYAGYNSYKYHDYKINKEWYKVNFGQLEDSNDGIFFQMWLSNILTYLYGLEDIKNLKSNDYEMYILSARFMEKYEDIMEAING